MSIYELTLNDYLDAAASKSATPGGGSVSAVVAANASAMVSMVANLTLGKKAYAAVQEDIKAILSAMDKILMNIKELTEKDMQAFQRFMDAWRLPSANSDEQVAKNEAVEKAAINASLVPLELGAACLAILQQAVQLASIGNKSAISDVGVGAYLAEGALKSALLSVDINLPLIADHSAKEKLQAEEARLIAEAEELKQLAIAKVRERMV
jgi:methenyltetrahydrofolate cyclohydrolase